MDYLKEWVRSLVMLVLLASCLELLLPMNSMKKFVRLTLGLLVVLTVLQPAMDLLGQPAATVDATTLLGEDRRDLPTLHEIMAQADQFRAKNQELVASQVQAKLSEEVRQAAKSVPGVADAKALVQLSMVGSEWQIREIAVTIRPGSSDRPGPVAPVQPVKPVQIGPGTEQGRPPDPTRGEERELDERLAQQVRQAIRKRLGLEQDGVPIRVLLEQTESHGG